MSAWSSIAEFLKRRTRRDRDGAPRSDAPLDERGDGGLRTFVNESTDGVIGFVRPNPHRGEEYERGILKPGVAINPNRFYGGITIAGERVFNLIIACGTCGFLFEKLGESKAYVDDDQAVALLGELDALPDDAVLSRLAAILPPGKYFPLILESIPRLVRRNGEGDYLSGEYVKLFGLDPPDYVGVPDPKTPYYRMGEPIRHRHLEPAGDDDGWLFSFLAPLHDPGALDRSRVDHWREIAATGRPLTAFALSAFELHGPAVMPTGSDPNYRFSVHLELKSVLLDGHHRVQAAAESKIPIRVLAMVSRDASAFQRYRGTNADAPRVLLRCGRQ